MPTIEYQKSLETDYAVLSRKKHNSVVEQSDVRNDELAEVAQKLKMRQNRC